ncbi:hypothetical protein EYF80_018811 [Liparis tanakae]|uniref:Uncharacterized protein n=1 Tax=Liparis tanakae TaxID=230148 RepID=A0A4Z2I079_9TELE|nr:hypothetical protein EYF80_018811 [Liparis tanakae]
MAATWAPNAPPESEWSGEKQTETLSCCSGCKLKGQCTKHIQCISGCFARPAPLFKLLRNFNLNGMPVKLCDDIVQSCDAI